MLAYNAWRIGDYYMMLTQDWRRNVEKQRSSDPVALPNTCPERVLEEGWGRFINWQR